MESIAEEEGPSSSSSQRKKKKKSKKKDSNGSSRGFGARIRRMVSGRKKRKSDDDDESGISFLESSNDPRKGGMDSNNMNQFLNDDPSSKNNNNNNNGANGNSNGGYGDRGFGKIPEEREFDEDGNELDQMSYGEPEEAVDDPQGDLSGPISMVLLLVDPDTLRFELLQLEFDQPNQAKVADVLEQIPTSVTEPAIRTLEFQALVDRQGGQFGPKVNLAKALRYRRKSKDILVGLSKGVTTEHCSRLARPILGDTKVIGMLELNGYDPKGWTKAKEEESELRDAPKETFAAKERKMHLQILAVIVGVTLILWAVYALVGWYFGAETAERLTAPLQDWVSNITNASSILNTSTTSSSSGSSSSIKLGQAVDGAGIETATGVDDFVILEEE